MLNRIATALAVATFAGFLAAGPAMADSDDDGGSRGDAVYYNEGHSAGQWASNVGGPLGVTNMGMAAAGFENAGGYHWEHGYDFDNGHDDD
ncbi:hypothetical protein [Streptomyces sp. NPDC016845]|uniref:hypothetical protein n=1 Tax=Streptomyces sp. NPDC016845 TaxID=3364972 RepID=UPI00379B84BF